MIDLVPNAARLQAMFAQAAAPAFLLAGIAAFISILLSRLTAVMAQLRTISEMTDSNPVHAKRRFDIPLLKKRASLLHRATYLALLAGIATVLLLILMAGFTFFGVEHVYGGAALFGLATILFTMALFKFAQEIRAALHEIDGL